MSTYQQVDPAKFINVSQQLPAHGRGAWVKEGIDFEYRYTINPPGAARIGTVAEKSLAHWAVAAGAAAIQRRLQKLGFMGMISAGDYGCWGSVTDAAFRKFQAASKDPDGGAQLVVDGLCGRSDSRALWTPLIDAAEKQYGIPSHFLRGEMYHESNLDAGAVGYYIYYQRSDGSTRYGGVDRGIAQCNSDANSSVTWDQAFDPTFIIPWSASRMKTYYNKFKSSYPSQPDSVLWDAAICAHNNPTAAEAWAKAGMPTTTDAASYVSAVKSAIY